MGTNRKFASVLASTTIFLWGCTTTPDTDVQRAQTPDDTAPAQAAETADADSSVAPEKFGKSEDGIWDGRPSLGGIWIAHPDVSEPRRVLIENEKNGRVIVGVLFKREREFPGPKFQVSADAANAIALLPGAPTQISVTAFLSEGEERAANAKVKTQMAALKAAPVADETYQVAESSDPGRPADSTSVAATEPGSEPDRLLAKDRPAVRLSEADRISDAEIARSIRLAEFLQENNEANEIRDVRVVAVEQLRITEAVAAMQMPNATRETNPESKLRSVPASAVTAVQSDVARETVMAKRDDSPNRLADPTDSVPVAVAAVQPAEIQAGDERAGSLEALNVQHLRYLSGKLDTGFEAIEAE